MKRNTIILIVTIVLGGLAVFFFSPYSIFHFPYSNLSAPDLRLPGEAKMSDEPVVPDGWKYFKNEQYSISLYHPSELAVKVYDEGQGAHTFVFESADASQGFQIFVVPYTEATISEARFRKDSPSGVRNEPVEISIDKTSATAFFGQNPVMGETREVWFIKGGYLYEIVTFKSDDAWLSEIMKTWRFTP